MAYTVAPSPARPRTVKRKPVPYFEPEIEELGPRDSATKTESLDSYKPADSSSGVFYSSIPQFDLETTFPAILAPIRLLHNVAESQDLDSLRALTRVFSQCLLTIFHSMNQLPVDVRYTSAYKLSECAVQFSKKLFLCHVNQLEVDGFEPVNRRDFIWQGLQLLDMTMSALKEFMQTAERELQRKKPLPEPPVEFEEEEEEVEEYYEEESGTCEESRLSSEGASTDQTCVEEADELGSLVKPPTKKPKRRLAAIISASLRRTCSKKHKKSSTAPTDTAAACEKAASPAGRAFATTNIRNSIAIFPELFDGKLDNSIHHPEDGTELYVDQNGVLQLASIKGLVRYLTSTVSDNDLELVDVFFLTFRYFATPALLLDAFIERYREALPDDLSPDQAPIESLHIKLRVARLLHKWVDLHWRHSDDHAIFATLTQFAFSDLSQDLPREVSSQIINTLHHAACAKEHNGRRLEKTIQSMQDSSPIGELSSTWEPRDKKAMMKGEFTKIKLSQFASPKGIELLTHQLTVVLLDKYRDFQPEDATRFWVEEATGKTTYGVFNDAGPKVTTYASFEKALHLWVIDAIVSEPSVESRVAKVQFFLDWAQECHKIRNYAGSWALYSACDRHSLIGNSLDIGAKHDEIRLYLRLFFSPLNRMKSYKEAIQKSLGPTLPTLVLFVGDVKRQCGNEPCVEHPNVPGGEKLINLRRYRPLTRAIQDMEKCHTPYHIQRVDYVCHWMEQVVCAYLSLPELEWENIIYEKSQRLVKNNRK
ncbi:hypothetical protein AZE42_01399 [Rhizopogon vesiculosus]|uniref:N-terminal Ras-GEF domain-containing protein n=1 Tax=Rhizopogon vesiculosus TaxID=180088 RepID=A0A1J8Q7I0_9AGAM|nr:hypothetical protein AZE42_01399 [Rhizopogon vesiculosus]